MRFDDVDVWVYFDGPEPARIRPLLHALRHVAPVAPEEKERVARRFFERLDAALAGEEGQARGEGEVAAAGGAASAASTASVRPEGERRVTEDGATARSPTFEDRRDAVRVEPIAAAPVIEVRGLAAPPEAAEARAPEGLVGTAMAIELSAEVREQLGRLPFKSAAEAQAAGKVAARTLQVPVMRRGHGETVPIGDDSIAKAVAALPFAGNTVGAGVVALPRLTVEQYASLRAEMAVWPERVGEIRRRYWVVNEAAGRALDEHWEAWLARQPEARVVFERAVGEYTAWLRGVRRQGGGRP